MNTNSGFRHGARARAIKTCLANRQVTRIARISIFFLILIHNMSLAFSAPNKSVKSASSSKSVIQTSNGQGVYKNGRSKLEEQLDMLKNYKKNNHPINSRLHKEDDVMVYPNPAINEITVAYNIKGEEKATFVIYDLLGRERIKTTFYGGVITATINVSALETGVYLYSLQKQDKTTFTGKLIIE